MGYFDDMETMELNMLKKKGVNDIPENETLMQDKITNTEKCQEVEKHINLTEVENDEKHFEEVLEKSNLKKPISSKTNDKECLKTEDTVSSSKMTGDITDSIIASGITIDGNVTCGGVLTIGGIINGDVYSETDVTVLKYGVINGNLESKGRVSVIGKICGNIQSKEINVAGGKIKGELAIEKDAVIEKEAIVIGNIKALNTTIWGAVKGDVNTRKLVIEDSAIIKGNMHSTSVYISEDACVDGTCTQNYSEEKPSKFFENLGV